MSDQDAYTISEFCKRHNFSRGFYYILQKKGQGPKVVELGGKRLITREAAETWRAGLDGGKSTSDKRAGR